MGFSLPYTRIGTPEALSPNNTVSVGMEGKFMIRECVRFMIRDGIRAAVSRDDGC